jgi:predicted GIY-YIG superfamily endonuclease
MPENITIGQANLQHRRHALYRIFDRTDALLYVGITADLGKRLATHQRNKSWWHEVNNITIEHFSNRSRALEAEAHAIRTENPLYNSQHNTFVQADAVETKAIGEWALSVLQDLFDEDQQAHAMLAAALHLESSNHAPPEAPAAIALRIAIENAQADLDQADEVIETVTFALPVKVWDSHHEEVVRKLIDRDGFEPSRLARNSELAMRVATLLAASFGRHGTSWFAEFANELGLTQGDS